MRGCGVFTGILFSRKLCPQPAATTCGRCATPLCKVHVRPQDTGPFLCPSCHAYANDDDDHWRYSSRDRGWRYRSDADERAAGVATGTAAGAAAANADELSDEDRAGLSTNAAGAWHGPDDTSPDSDDADSGTDDGDFDAS